MEVLVNDDEKDEYEEGLIVGDTCDGMDVIYKGVLPKGLDIGDLLVFDNFGAYTLRYKVFIDLNLT